MSDFYEVIFGTKAMSFITNEEGRVVPINAPGSGGGTSGGGAIVTRRQEPRGIITNYYDEMAEKNALFDPDPKNPQGSIRKDGVTREQLEVWSKRRRAVQDALNVRYTNMSRNDSRNNAVAQIDPLIDKGYSQVKVSNRWTGLTNPNTGETMRFSTAAERNYIDVALNRGQFKKNY